MPTLYARWLELLYATIAVGADQLDVFSRDADQDDPDGSSDARLTDDPAKDDYGKPGPGDLVVFVSERDGNSELYLMNLDGSNQRRLTYTPDVRENLPSW